MMMQLMTRISRMMQLMTRISQMMQLMTGISRMTGSCLVLVEWSLGSCSSSFMRLLKHCTA